MLRCGGGYGEFRKQPVKEVTDMRPMDVEKNLFPRKKSSTLTAIGSETLTMCDFLNVRVTVGREIVLYVTLASIFLGVFIKGKPRRKDSRHTITLNLEASVCGTKMTILVSLGTSAILIQFSEKSDSPAVIRPDIF
jgi:hypothetical protein